MVAAYHSLAQPDMWVSPFSTVHLQGFSGLMHVQATLRKLFCRIDANCDGTVNWDEFSLYMLLERQGKADIVENGPRRSIRQPEFLSRVRSSDAHSRPIDCCSYIPACGGNSARYATGARDGTVKLWDCKVRTEDHVVQSCADSRPLWFGHLGLGAQIVCMSNSTAHCAAGSVSRAHHPGLEQLGDSHQVHAHFQVPGSDNVRAHIDHVRHY